MQRADQWMTVTANSIASDLLPASGPPTAVAAPAPASDNIVTDIPDLLMATRSFELNAAVVARADDAYQSAIDILTDRR
jgi:hypothetical protein